MISEDIKTSYLENDGNITADVVSIQSEFDSRDSNISAGEVDEVRAENDRGTDMPATGTEPGADTESGSDEQPRQL